MIQTRLAALVVCMVIPYIPAFSYEIPEPVTRFRDAFYMQEEDVDALYRLYRTTLADLGDLGLDDRDLLYWEAQSAFYMAGVYQVFDNPEMVRIQYDELRRGRFKKVQKLYTRLDEMIEYYEKALSLAASYLEGGRDARGVRLYAESLSQLSTLKTTGYLMANGTKISPLAQEAVELDPTEVKAHILLASRYVYSPKIWGGNPDRGIAMMETARDAGSPNREDQFNLAVGIGYAHSMAGRFDEAAEYYRAAATIYPGNVYARAMADILENGGS